MKRTVRLITAIFIAAFAAVACSGAFKDLALTSCALKSVTPVGLTSLDAVAEVGVRNPAMQFSVTRMRATLKMDGLPCIKMYADDITVESRSEKTYPLNMHMVTEDGFNLLSLLVLLNGDEISRMTMDVSFRGALRNGIGKDFEYKDIPLKDLMSQL